MANSSHGLLAFSHGTYPEHVSRDNNAAHGAAHAATCLLESRRANDSAATLRKHNIRRGTMYVMSTSTVGVLLIETRTVGESVGERHEIFNAIK